MTTTEQTKAKKNLSALKEATKRSVFPILAISAVGAHFISLIYIQSSFKLLVEGGLTKINIDPIINSLSGQNSLAVYFATMAALFFLLMALNVTFAQSMQMRKSENKGE